MREALLQELGQIAEQENMNDRLERAARQRRRARFTGRIARYRALLLPRRGR